MMPSESGRRPNPEELLRQLQVEEQKNLSSSDQAAIDSHLAPARELGAEVHFLETGNPVTAIVEFARVHGVSQLFVGHSLPRGWQGFMSRNALDRLIRAAQGVGGRLLPMSS